MTDARPADDRDDSDRASSFDPFDPDWLGAERERLLRFGRDGSHPDGGFAWLDDAGRPMLDRPVELWITCRMTHVYALGHLLDFPDAGHLVDHGLAALTGRLRDGVGGGWFAAVGADGPTTPTKGAYEHAFVVLAASSGAAAGRPGAEAVLAEALEVQDRHFWDEDAGAVVDTYLDPGFTELEAYRGANANMHTLEAYLAAAEVTGQRQWLERAERIVERFVAGVARDNDWRLIEHFDPDWRPLPDHNRDQPAHPFRPYGATIGHAFEWARLTLDLDAALGGGSSVLLGHAVALFERGVTDGWSVDGAPGFVYTTDWDGTPVVRNRLHWVTNEATNAAAALHRATGDERYAAHYRRWWSFALEHHIDHDGGSWIHELDERNRPAASVWSGKPDLYHAVQATLVPLLPLAPALASALAGETGDERGVGDRTRP